MTFKILISSNPENLRSTNPDVTIEAEYGKELVEGKLLTLAHHGTRSHNPAPCVLKNMILDNVNTIGISHIDLDTIGGIMAVLGIKTYAPEFWALAGFVDVAGPHNIDKTNSSKEAKKQLQAYWAWSKSERYFPPRDGSVDNVTEIIYKHIEIIEKILGGDNELLKAGEDFVLKEITLNYESFQLQVERTIIRKHKSFCNHLYVTPRGDICDSVISYNTETGAITLSFAASYDPRNACKIMQEVFGNLAGGHKGIAGSPRGEFLEFERVFDVLNKLEQ
jgi:hypothetical protein